MSRFANQGFESNDWFNGKYNGDAQDPRRTAMIVITFALV
jgi:hypothetical protein